MNEVTSEAGTVGQQLRAARERQGVTLEDVAARTRIPTRHLQSLEDSEWSKLPAPTYTIGFAKSYAGVLGLDRTEIGEALRAEMGGGALAARPVAQVFEPADPAKVMPRWLVLVALLALVAVAAAFLWNRNRQLNGPDEVAVTEPAAGVAEQGAAAPAEDRAAAVDPHRGRHRGCASGGRTGPHGQQRFAAWSGPDAWPGGNADHAACRAAALVH
jgi:cytoskeletal protein RodZ